LFLRKGKDASYELPPGTKVLVTPEDLRSNVFRSFFESVTSRYAGHRGPEATVDVDVMLSNLRRVREYDVAIYNDQYTALMGILNLVLHRRPYVMVFHEFYPKVHVTLPKRIFLYPLADLYDAIALLVAPAVVTTGSRNFERLRRLVSHKLFLARNGAPAPKRLDPDRRSRESVCAISIWDSGRHPELYLELAKIVPQFRFTIAGMWPDDRYRGEIEARARSLPNVRITGPIDESERERVLENSLLYLRLGYGEAGPGMGGLEAMARGSIVIANRDLGISEIIESGINGFVVEDVHPETIARLLTQIAQLSAADLGRISEASLALAAAHSWSEHARVLGRALNTALGSDASSSDRELVVGPSGA
jgi:glycosyltransferase involved in cell wall biosynthesis